MQTQKTFFYVLIRSRNSFKYFDRCITSVLNQKYNNYIILYIDDNSEYTTKQKKYIKQKLKDHTVVFNTVRKYSLRNAYEAIHKYATKENSVIVSLDGDDWLYTSNTLQQLDGHYTNDTNIVATYGDCYTYDKNGLSSKLASKKNSFCNIPYPEHIIKNKLYRKYPFLPLHLRTWKTNIFKEIKKQEFLDDQKKWLRFCEDQAIFFPILEKYAEKVKCIQEPLSVYNISSDNSDNIVNTNAQLKDELLIRKKNQQIQAKNDFLDYKRIRVQYSSLMSLPLISHAIYITQVALISYLPVVLLSARKTKVQEKLLKSLTQYDQLVINTHKLGNQLLVFHDNSIIYDGKINLNVLQKKDLLDLYWTLILSQGISKKSSQFLHSFIPRSMIVSESIFIPLHVPMNEYCNFVIKTSQSLQNKGHQISIVPFNNRKWIIGGFFNVLKELIYSKNIVTPFTFFPLSWEKSYKIKQINDWFVNKYLHMYFKLKKMTIFWSFDFENLNLFKQIKTIKIYDCVDNYTSNDPLIAEKIKDQEKQMIQQSTYFFTNSKALLKMHIETRKSNLVVQGFDFDEFTKNKKLDSCELKEIIRVKKIIKNKNPKTILGFVGNLNYRLDFDLLFSLLKNHPEYLLIITNASQETITEDSLVKTKQKIKKLGLLPNTVFVMKSSNKQYIKQLISLFDYGTIPYNTRMSFNKYSYPMKLFEYFYMGKPVLSTKIVELLRFKRYALASNRVKDWENVIENRLLDNKNLRKMQNLAFQNRWDKKVDQILSVVQK